MDLFELIFENVDSTSVKHIFDDFYFGNVISIGSLPQSNIVNEGNFVEQITCLLKTTEEYVFINFDESKFGSYSLHKPSISFYKYNGKIGINFLFEQEYDLITEDFLAFFRIFSEKKVAQLKAKNCFFGLEPATDEDTQLFCITR